MPRSPAVGDARVVRRRPPWTQSSGCARSSSCARAASASCTHQKQATSMCSARRPPIPTRGLIVAAGRRHVDRVAHEFQGARATPDNVRHGPRRRAPDG
jgi:hypothetical protein